MISEDSGQNRQNDEWHRAPIESTAEWGTISNMERPASRTRYDVSGNLEGEYVDVAETVLVNKKGVTDLPAIQRLEEEGLAAAYESLFSEVRIDTPMTCELLRHIHQRIFGDLYEWAGRWRTLNISKPGAVWPAAAFLDSSMQGLERDVLSKHPARMLAADAEFCRAAGEIQGEFLAIHPFREGNARTIKLMTNLLAAQTGRPPLVYDQSDEGAQRYIAAASAALLKKNYQPLNVIIAAAVCAAQLKPSLGAAPESYDAFPPGTEGAPQ